MPKDFNRTTRVAQEIQAELAKLIEHEVKDPRLGIVTITSVEVSRDLAHANIHFVVRDEEKDAKQSLMVLEKAAGFLRKRLGSEVVLRALPVLHFKYDTSSQYGRHMDNLLKDID